MYVFVDFPRRSSLTLFLFVDVFRYENKYVKFFKSKPDLPPGLNAAPAKQQQRVHGSGDSDGAGLSKSAKRNMKRKEKKKQQQQQGQDGEEDADVESISNAVESVSIAQDKESVNEAAPPSGDSAASEKAKKIKNLKKKLRQVEELKQKVDSGEIKQPTKDQLEKLGRAKALEEELEELERDS